jgi:photosystem II stability/assembly factor-like uncharacterized protein
MRRTFLILILLLFLAAPLFAWISYTLDNPVDQLLDNSAIDFVYDGVYVWVATGLGVSGTSDGGQTWRSYNKTNGLLDYSVSAIAKVGEELWVATTDSVYSNSVGAGLDYTADRGEHWYSFDDYRLKGRGRIIYDISVHDSLIVMPAFLSGLVRSTDNGNTWDNIFIDAEVAADYADDSLANTDESTAGSAGLRGRYFSSVIDPYHIDTLIVWAGSAAGVQRIYYINRSKKLPSNRIFDIAGSGDGRWWIATDMGISVFVDSSFTFSSYFEDDGLPGNYYTAVGANGDLGAAGLYDTLSQQADGFIVSTDGGLNWNYYQPAQATGPGTKVEEVEMWDNDIWAACNAGGLIRSTDLGSSWQTIYPPAGETPPEVLTHVHSIDIAKRDNFVRVSAGTDSGLVVLYYSDPNTLDSTVILPLFDNATWGQKVVSVATGVTQVADEFWLAVQPYKQDVGSEPAVLRSTNRGFFWDQFLTGPPAVTPYDIEMGPAFADTGTAIWVATGAGLRRTRNFGKNFDVFSAYGPAVGPKSLLHCVEVDSGKAFFGSDSLGMEATGDYGVSFFGFTAQNDPTKPDFVGRSYMGQTLPDTVTGLGANFIIALELQRTRGKSIVYAGGQATGLTAGERNGVYETSDRGLNWTLTLPDVQAFNFSFNGDTAFAATWSGLYMSPNEGESWERLKIVDQVSGRFISDSVHVNGVDVVGDQVWVGTDDGIAHASLNDLTSWTILRSFFHIPETAQGDNLTYASPSPFSPYIHQQMKFHYRLKNAGMVTIKIYDFANNLVKTVVKDVQRDADVQYDDIDVWDGRNGNDDIVAAGVYFYQIKSSGGDEYWGKFMVIP